MPPAPFLSRLFPSRSGTLSLARLEREAPALAAAFLWRTNRLPAGVPDPLWLHLGAGEHVLEGFLNLDFLPHDARVSEWDLLDPWPDRWPRAARGALSEDTLEHFYLAEQLYILCQMNRVLADGATFRVLMPSFARLLEYCRGFAPRPGEFLHDTFAVETEADAVNAGMRFSGHRWLHDDASLRHLALMAGFEPVKTTCAESTEPFLSGRNLRSEEGSAAFAHDLVRRRPLRHWSIAPARTEGLDLTESVGESIAFGRVAARDSRITYPLPEGLAAASIACINARGANLSSFREHSVKRLVFRGDWGEGAWSLDETLKSKACMNVVTRAAVARACAGPEAVVREIALEPGAAGDHVTVGPLELFAYDDPPAG